MNYRLFVSIVMTYNMIDNLHEWIPTENRGGRKKIVIKMIIFINHFFTFADESRSAYRVDSSSSSSGAGKIIPDVHLMFV